MRASFNVGDRVVLARTGSYPGETGTVVLVDRHNRSGETCEVLLDKPSQSVYAYGGNMRRRLASRRLDLIEEISNEPEDWS